MAEDIGYDEEGTDRLRLGVGTPHPPDAGTVNAPARELRATTVDAYESEWRLFCDWCDANDVEPVPATAEQVAEFLDDCPAAPSTIARRVTVINRVHDEFGYLSPGRAEDILATVREARGSGVRVTLADRFDPAEARNTIADLPVRGWPGGMVGRRDAALIALICLVGLSREDVRALTLASARRDPAAPVTSGAGLLVLDTRRGQLALGRLADAQQCPACAVARWLRAAVICDRRGFRAVRNQLAEPGLVDPAVHDCDRPLLAPYAPDVPLFCRVDRWGRPEQGTVLSKKALTTLVATRLIAPPPEKFTPYDPELFETLESRTEPDAAPVVAPPVYSDADYRNAMASRQHAVAKMAEVADLLDLLEEKAEAALAASKQVFE